MQIFMKKIIVVSYSFVELLWSVYSSMIENLFAAAKCLVSRHLLGSTLFCHFIDCVRVDQNKAKGRGSVGESTANKSS